MNIQINLAEQAFYIYEFASLNSRFIKGENPDSVGVFWGNIFFVASLWCR